MDLRFEASVGSLVLSWRPIMCWAGLKPVAGCDVLRYTISAMRISLAQNALSCRYSTLRGTISLRVSRTDQRLIKTIVRCEIPEFRRRETGLGVGDQYLWDDPACIYAFELPNNSGARLTG